MNVRKGFARLARVAAITYGAVAVITLGVVAYGAWQVEGAGMIQFRVDLSARGEVLRSCGRQWNAEGVEIPCDRKVERSGFTFIFPYDATDAEVDRAILFAVNEELLTLEHRRERAIQQLSVEQELAAIRARARERRALREQAAQAAATAGERLFLPPQSGSNEFRSIAPVSDSSEFHRQTVARVPHLLVWAESGRAAIDLARRLCSRPNVACGEYQEGAEVVPDLSDRMRYVLRNVWQPALSWLGVYLALWAIFRAVRYVALGFMDKGDVAKSGGSQ